MERGLGSWSLTVSFLGVLSQRCGGGGGGQYPGLLISGLPYPHPRPRVATFIGREGREDALELEFQLTNIEQDTHT